MKVSIKERHLEFIARALGKYPSAQHQALIVELWRDHKYINPEAFTYISRQDRERTFQLLVPYLEAFEKNHRTIGEERLVQPMVSFLLNYDREVAVRVIATNLRTADIPYFEEFVPFVRLLKEDAFIEPLFYRLEREWNAYIVFDAVEALLVYDRPEIQERILPASRKNEEIVDQYFSRADLERTIRKMLAK
ncbi:hypothetical protein [Flavilitoribacter nigricans]|uniref:HEAT repeat domain-containing protein n=1 Tax=Flavilitoribacter nigricans (strain ATCC 23147 / DSM 23189 / NBRC 102662 / NCIMB 1420 / SS-2) TaxID=1122177 RepID=A0A2D0NGY2_FLAN2|nr:hypothetical protein [Flavilitoribacter nigricans]PHN07764.1 hypothetical protein CRP01_04790 [Flavilitoribacter nigricans DSM 23189 = NBRC 102662]